jgi:hypothetical protein
MQGANPSPKPAAGLVSVLLVAPVALVLLASDAQATALFADGFATNPDTSGQWTIYRKTPDTANEASWDAGAGTLYLTRPVGDRATAIFANHALTEHSWNATFKYRTGGGGSALINPLLTGTPLAGALGGGADGFVFLFYKSQQPYASSPPAPGAALGFTTAGGAVPGYGIAFNEWNGNTVRLIKDSADNTLATTTDARVGDDAWHTAMVRFSDGRVKVGIDGGIILDTVLPTVNYTFSGVGFSAATGGNTNNHAIDDFQLSAEAPLASKLLSPRAHASAVWTGTRAFVFGGTTDGSTMLDGIERYDPVTDVSTLMAAKLPTPRTATSAVWTGTHAYIFGGVVSSCYCQTKQILRYDPATDTVTTMAAQLPEPMPTSSAGFRPATRSCATTPWPT